MTSDIDAQLFEAAKEVRKRAHVPYSHYPVGAAILADDGKIYAGCNIENAAYSQASCAEATAISVMIAAGGRRIERIYIIGNGTNPVTPCGGCRQRIREFADPDTPVICRGVDGEPLEMTLDGLLPRSFGPGHLDDAN